MTKTREWFSIVEEQWNGINYDEIVESGPRILIRHPDWTEEDPRQDIPIMVFTHEQWNALKDGIFLSVRHPLARVNWAAISNTCLRCPRVITLLFRLALRKWRRS